MWNPLGFMCDENGANKLAIREVFGKTMRKKSQLPMAFLRCIKKQLTHVPEGKRGEFIDLAKNLTTCVTKSDYVQITDQMAHLAKTKKWFEWWHLQCHHFVPVYRVFSLLDLNIAEVGISCVRKQHNFHLISLVDASFKDLSYQMRQDQRYLATINNDENLIGRGLNYHQLVQGGHKAKVGRTHVYINALNTGDAFLKESVLDKANTFQPNLINTIILAPKIKKVRSLLHEIHKYFPLQAQVQMMCIQIHKLKYLRKIPLHKKLCKGISLKCPKSLKTVCDKYVSFMEITCAYLNMSSS